jgi:hypothetical protein
VFADQKPEALVWLDYEHSLIMARVISRTFLRGILPTVARSRLGR